MEENIKCEKCGSYNLKIEDEDYLHSEDLEKRQSKYFMRYYLCWDCNHEWNEGVDRSSDYLSKNR
ncbi:MAG: hypothetical protein NT155_04130 [Candidatus Staskawiczbacteria bacterium]|nr:hypothetical protein [Candidatus Staskawiczbacteria bacterium]